MTTDEQDRLIVQMVKERNTLRRERTLLDEQLHTSRNGLSVAIRAVDAAVADESPSPDPAFNYQDAEALAGTIKRRHEFDVRIEELANRLDGCCNAACLDSRFKSKYTC